MPQHGRIHHQVSGMNGMLLETSYFDLPMEAIMGHRDNRILVQQLTDAWVSLFIPIKPALPVVQ